MFRNTILINSIWLFLDKGYGALLTLYVYSLLAKYFGVDLFGTWNYLLAFSSIVPALASLGLNYVIVKNIKEKPALNNLILGNAILTRSIAGFVTGIILWVIYYFLKINIESKFLIVLGLLFISQILLNSNVFVFQNEAHLQNNRTVLFRNLALTISSLFRIGAIKLQMDIVVFAFINIIEYGLFLFLSWSFSGRQLTGKDLKLRRKITLTFIKEGMPLMLSAVVVVLYLKIDQMIIAYLMDNKSVGIYSAASRISEFLYAVPVIISNVFFPKIIEVKSDIKQRNKLLDQMHFSIIVLSVLSASLIYFFSEHIITLLFGPLYSSSAPILRIYAWSLVFMGLLVGSSKYLLTIGRNDIILKRGLFGLGSNILLNFILIPILGIVGAAYSTLISYFLASYLSNIFFKELRPLMIDQIAAIVRIPKTFFYK